MNCNFFLSKNTKIRKNLKKKVFKKKKKTEHFEEI